MTAISTSLLGAEGTQEGLQDCKIDVLMVECQFWGPNSLIQLRAVLTASVSAYEDMFWGICNYDYEKRVKHIRGAAHKQCEKRVRCIRGGAEATCSYMPAKPSQSTLSSGGAYFATLQCSWPSAICSSPNRRSDPLRIHKIAYDDHSARAAGNVIEDPLGRQPRHWEPCRTLKGAVNHILSMHAASANRHEILGPPCSELAALLAHPGYHTPASFSLPGPAAYRCITVHMWIHNHSLNGILKGVLMPRGIFWRTNADRA